MLWVIGDVHGEKNILENLLAKIDEEERCPICNAQRKTDKHESVCSRRGWDAIYSVGDIVDRGPDSLGAIDLCVKHGIKVVRGNHEDMALDFFFDQKRYRDGIWGSNGGTETFNQIHELIQKEKDATTAEKEANKYIDWMLSLPYYYTHDKFLISHAGVCDNPVCSSPMLSILKACEGLQPPILWNRGKIRHRDYFQVVGHSIRRNVTITDRYANVDTGAFLGGGLSAIHLPDKKVITVGGRKIW